MHMQLKTSLYDRRNGDGNAKHLIPETAGSDLRTQKGCEAVEAPTTNQPIPSPCTFESKKSINLSVGQYCAQ